MASSLERSYMDGYITGYRDGLRDGASGKTAPHSREDLLALPVGSMDLSVRARNCLSRTGCGCIGDVAGLTADSIRSMRNLGPKTAAEVARQLHALGILGTAWQAWL